MFTGWVLIKARTVRWSRSLQGLCERQLADRALGTYRDDSTPRSSARLVGNQQPLSAMVTRCVWVLPTPCSPVSEPPTIALAPTWASTPHPRGSQFPGLGHRPDQLGGYYLYVRESVQFHSSNASPLYGSLYSQPFSFFPQIKLPMSSRTLSRSARRWRRAEISVFRWRFSNKQGAVSDPSPLSTDFPLVILWGASPP